jgi:hypothetical protein
MTIAGGRRPGNGLTARGTTPTSAATRACRAVGVFTWRGDGHYPLADARAFYARRGATRFPDCSGPRYTARGAADGYH